MKRILIFFGTLLCQVVFCVPTNHLPGEQAVPNFANLVIAPYPELHTQILYSRNGLIPAGDLRGVVLLYPGTSGAPNSEYGLARSLGPLANQLVNQGYAVIAFQPPIYWMASDNVARLPFLQRYSQLENNLMWLMDTAQLVHEVIHHEAGGRRLDQWYYGRSTFAAIGTEAYHRWAMGDPRFAPVGRFRKMLLPGLDGHTQQEIARWHAEEREFYFVLHPGKGDRPVIEAAPQIFQDMRWQTEPIPNAPLIDLNTGPTLCFTVGIRDEFSKAPLIEMLTPIADFVRLHPGASVELKVHSGGHNPAQALMGETSSEVSQRLNLILTSFLDPSATSTGFRFDYIPNKKAILRLSPTNLPTSYRPHHWHSSSHRAFDRCHTFLHLLSSKR